MSLFPQEQDAVPPAIDLGLVRGAPVLCAHGNYETGGLIGCWSIDVAAGKMSKVASTPPPGHSVRSTTDANGCVEGYCADPKPEAGENVLWAKNTTGDRVAFVHSYTLHVFDASSKAQLGTVPLSEENAPGNTNVGNEPIELLYVGRTIFVLGSDAGPYAAVWAFGDDGTRKGFIADAPQQAPAEEAYGFSVYLGSANVRDEGHVAVANAGVRRMIVVDAATDARQIIDRQVSTDPCNSDEIAALDTGELDLVSDACRATLKKDFEPYFDLDPVLLPTGELLAALSGEGRGSLAVLDGQTLKEKRRIPLPRCPN